MKTNIEDFDILSYLQSRSIPYSFDSQHATEDNIALHCPFCNDASDHLGVQIHTLDANCWRCGKKWIPYVVQELEGGIPLSEAFTIIEHFPKTPFLLRDETTSAQSSQPYTSPSHKSLSSQRTSPDSLLPTRISPDGSSAMCHWLEQRGFPPEDTIHRWDIRWGGVSGFWKFRAVLPVMLQQQCYTAVGRDITGLAPMKYLNLPNNQSLLPIKSTLYNFDSLRQGHVAVVVEGPIDVWKLGEGAVATYGTQFTVEQIVLLHTIQPRHIFILYDREPEAQRMAERMAGAIWFTEVSILTLDSHNDPGDLTLEEGRKLMNELRYRR